MNVTRKNPLAIILHVISSFMKYIIMLLSAVIVSITIVPIVSTCSWDTFVRDTAIVDKVTNSTHLRIQNGTESQSDCAILCFQTNICISFFYNSVSRICRLRSDTIRAEDVTLQKDIGYHYFRGKHFPPIITCFLL